MGTAGAGTWHRSQFFISSSLCNDTPQLASNSPGNVANTSINSGRAIEAISVITIGIGIGAIATAVPLGLVAIGVTGAYLLGEAIGKFINNLTAAD